MTTNRSTPYKDITKREFFAAMAMQGLLANPDVNDLEHRKIARSAVHNAEALITALNQKEE